MGLPEEECPLPDGLACLFGICTEWVWLVRCPHPPHSFSSLLCCWCCCLSQPALFSSPLSPLSLSLSLALSLHTGTRNQAQDGSCFHAVTLPELRPGSAASHSAAPEADSSRATAGGLAGGGAGAHVLHGRGHVRVPAQVEARGGRRGGGPALR
eukprot:2645277-Rhodomonas_salina.2